MPDKPDKTELERLLSIYIDGACSDAQRQVVEAALRTDPALRALYSQLRQTVDCVKAIGAESAPNHLRERILSQLERRALLNDAPPASHGSRTFRPLVMLATAAMVLAAAGVGWFVYTSRMSAPERRTLLADKSAARPELADRPLYEPPQAPAVAPALPQAVPHDAVARPVARDVSPAGGPARGFPQNPEPPAGSADSKPIQVVNSLADAAPGEAAAKGASTADEVYRQAAAKALVARQLASQEVAAAEAASERAAERVAAAQSAARQAAVARAAVNSPPASQPIAVQRAPEAPVAPTEALAEMDALARVQQAGAGQGQSAASSLADVDGAAGQDSLELVPAVSHMLPRLFAESSHVGALEVRCSSAPSDRPATAAAVQLAVRQLGGRLTQLAIGPETSTVIAIVPADRKYLLADQVTRIATAKDVTLCELAADATSLEIASVLSQPKVIWYPVRLGASIQPVDQSHSVPVRIVIRAVPVPADLPSNP